MGYIRAQILSTWSATWVVPAGARDRYHAACREGLDRRTVFRPLAASWKSITAAGEFNDKLAVHQTSIGFDLG